MVSFCQVAWGSGVDHFRFHIPDSQGMGQASQGMGVNPPRPHFVGPQLYQPPLPAPIPEENADDVSAEPLDDGENSP